MMSAPKRAGMGRGVGRAALAVLLVGSWVAAACNDEVETEGSGTAAANSPYECVRSCLADPCCEGYQCVADGTPRCGTCSSTVYTCVNGQWKSEASGCRPECICSVGELRPCTCPDGSSSVEECEDVGIDHDWGPCQCGGAGGSAGGGGAGGNAGGGTGGD